MIKSWMFLESDVDMGSAVLHVIKVGFLSEAIVQEKIFVTSSAILDLINMYFDSSLTIIYYRNGRKYENEANNC